MKTIDVLNLATEVLNENGWCQGKLRSNRGEVCALGALAEARDRLFMQAAKDDPYYSPQYERHRTEIGECTAEAEGLLAREVSLETYGVKNGSRYVSIPAWNDHMDRTKEDVLLMFKRAVHNAEERGK